MAAISTPIQQNREQSDGPVDLDETRQQSHTLGKLFKTLAEETQALTNAEAELIRTEVRDKVREAGKGVTSMITGVVALADGLLILLLAAVFGLATVLPLWASALIVGAIVTLIAASMVQGGKTKMEAENLKPKRSIEEAQNTKQFIQELAK